MILDHFNHAFKYLHLNKNLSTAFLFLFSSNLLDLSPGKHLINGEQVFAVVIHQNGLGKEKAVFEAHKKYLDLHCIISGRDLIGWKTLSKCTTGSAYNEKEDYFLLSEKPELYVEVPENYFTIFFPEDAHAALAGDNSVKKIVMKVRI